MGKEKPVEGKFVTSVKVGPKGQIIMENEPGIIFVPVHEPQIDTDASAEAELLQQAVEGVDIAEAFLRLLIAEEAHLGSGLQDMDLPAGHQKKLFPGGTPPAP